MEVYATQPSSEVLKCQQHVVVPNLRLHPHHHHHTAPRLHHHSHSHNTHHLQLPKLQIGTGSISAPASPSVIPTTPTFSTPSSSSSSAPNVEMKRSYEQTKAKTKDPSSRHTKRSVHVSSTGASASPSTSSPKNGSSTSMKSLPLVTPCHKDKMAAAAALNANSSTKMGVPGGKSNGASKANNNNNGEPPAVAPNVICEPDADAKPANSEKKQCDSPRADVFLGGSCNPTTWRTDKAIPLLKKLGISYYNPQVATWCPELISLEHEAKTHAKCLLFVIDSQTRSVVGLIEVAFLAAQGRKVVLVLPNQERTPGQSIMGEKISQSEFEELSSAHLLLKTLVERHQIPVFNDLDEAIHCIAKILPQAPARASEIASADEKNLRNVFESLSEAGEGSGEMKISQIPQAFRLVTKAELGVDKVRAALERFSQHTSVSRSQSSSSTAGSTSSSSSGDDSPPLKKDLVGEERFKQPLTNGGHHQNPNANAESLRTSDRINLEEFKHLMTELLLVDENRSAEALPRVKEVLEKVLEQVGGQNPCVSLSSSERRSFDVYLPGMTAMLEGWRLGKAIPLLKKHNLTHCSMAALPRAEGDIDSDSESISRRAFPADDCRLLFIYLNNSSRAVELMTLASYYVGLDRHRLVFCIEDLQDDCQSGDENLTKIAIKDYNRGRAYISDIAKRNDFPVFQDLDEALEKVVELCKASNAHTHAL